MNRLNITQHPRNKHLLAALVLLAFAVVNPAMAVEEPTPLETYNKDMKMVADLIHNIRVKIRVGATGLSTSGGEDRRATPAEVCCSGNLKLIRTRFESMESILDDFDACQSKRGNRDATQSINVVREDLKVLNTGINAFETTSESSHLPGLQAGLTRAYLNLLASSKNLADCAAAQPQ
jgi:hypothetical protein